MAVAMVRDVLTDAEAGAIAAAFDAHGIEDPPGGGSLRLMAFGPWAVPVERAIASHYGTLTAPFAHVPEVRAAAVEWVFARAREAAGSEFAPWHHDAYAGPGLLRVAWYGGDFSAGGGFWWRDGEGVERRVNLRHNSMLAFDARGWHRREPHASGRRIVVVFRIVQAGAQAVS